ncbi:MAG TPA: T9SS type A sorting domain-containing protein, partial [Salinivirgaceae bacterium]|nr:T9SS type A sorting domain-containing protein [Salinivirgaceae bacterium]
SLLGEDENSYNTFSIRVTPKGGDVAINNTPYKIDIDIFAVKDVININSLEPIKGTMAVYDITGKLVYYERLNGVYSHTVKNNNKTGIFIVVINGEQGYYSKKLFVE